MRSSQTLRYRIWKYKCPKNDPSVSLIDVTSECEMSKFALCSVPLRHRLELGQAILSLRGLWHGNVVQRCALLTSLDSTMRGGGGGGG